MTNKERLLSVFDKGTTEDALFITRNVCGLSLVQSMKFDEETLFDMGFGTVLASEEKECDRVVEYCIKKGMQFQESKPKNRTKNPYQLSKTPKGLYFVGTSHDLTVHLRNMCEYYGDIKIVDIPNFQVQVNV